MSARWGDLTAREVTDATGGAQVSGSPADVFAGISTDSRHTDAGQVFWALKGPRYDGHDFAVSALDKGAAGVVVDKAWWTAQKTRRAWDAIPGDFTGIVVDDTLTALGDFASWWRRCHPATVAAITGSSGKTTTKEMVAAICAQHRKTLKTEGNFNNLIGLPLTLLGLREDHETAILEMGMNRPGEIGRLTDIALPDVGVILNIGLAHLQGVMDLQGVARAKCEMMDRMRPETLMVLNGDDARLMDRAHPYGVHKVTFGLREENDVRAVDVQDQGLKGIQCTLVYRDDAWPARIRVPGVHNVSNALAAAAVAFSLGEPPESILHGLSTYAGVKGRFRIWALTGGITVIDDTYNANPSSLEAVLGSVTSWSGQWKRLIVGLGEMMELGGAAAASHEQAGKRVAKAGAGILFALGPHAPEMVQGAAGAGMSRKALRQVNSHDELIDGIAGAVGPDDVVLLKGSRKMGLEKVVEGLENVLGKRET